MELIGQSLAYELNVKDFAQKDSLKQYADHAVKEIRLNYGWETDVQIHIAPEVKDKQLYTVSMSVYGLGEPIVAHKKGRHVMSVLRKVRKTIMRQIHRMNERKIAQRRKDTFRAKMAS